MRPERMDTFLMNSICRATSFHSPFHERKLELGGKKAMTKLLPRWSNFRRYCDGGKTSARAVLNAFVIFCLTGIYVDTHWRLPFISSCEPGIKLTPAMAMRTLPLLYLNLGGEMMYVLDQRLVAQKIPGSKASKGSLKINNLLRTQPIFLALSFGRHREHHVQQEIH